jgi:hypothetical protein
MNHKTLLVRLKYELRKRGPLPPLPILAIERDEYNPRRINVLYRSAGAAEMMQRFANLTKRQLARYRGRARRR